VDGDHAGVRSEGSARRILPAPTGRTRPLSLVLGPSIDLALAEASSHASRPLPVVLATGRPRRSGGCHAGCDFPVLVALCYYCLHFRHSMKCQFYLINSLQFLSIHVLGLHGYYLSVWLHTFTQAFQRLASLGHLKEN